MTIKIDTREPAKIHKFLIETFPGIHFEAATLKEGDYESDRCLVERKTVADLYGSIIGSPGLNKPGRLHDQLERLSVHSNEKVLILLVTGSVGDYIAAVKHKMNIDQNTLYGEIASIVCRYNIMPLWIQHPQEALITMVKTMHKIDEGKWQLPARRDPHILSMKLLGVSNQQYTDLIARHKSLSNISRQPVSELTKIHGIGDVKARRILEVLNDTCRV